MSTLVPCACIFGRLNGRRPHMEHGERGGRLMPKLSIYLQLQVHTSLHRNQPVLPNAYIMGQAPKVRLSVMAKLQQVYRQNLIH
jgi:hypothetical protein